MSDLNDLLSNMMSGEGIKNFIEQYADKEVTGEAGAGDVKVCIDFSGNLKNVIISEEYIPDEKTREMLCQMLIVAFNNARANLLTSIGSKKS